MKLKRIAIFLLVAIIGWIILPPYKTVAQYAQRSSKALSQTPDKQGESGVEQTPQVSGEESKTKTDQVTKDNVKHSPIQTLESNTSRLENRRNNTQGIQAGGYSGRQYSKEEVIQLIKDYSAQYGIDSALPIRVASCESGNNQFSRNRSSTASGAFQFLASTWSHTDAGKQGISVFDADANVHMAIKSIANGGISNWASSKSCWSKN